jgi:hypothetical protein
MTFSSSPDLLTLHAVRLNGFADDAAIARRFELHVEETRVRLEKYAGDGLVGFSSFADVSGWSLTEAGRQTNEAQLRDELDLAAAREEVSMIHDQFLPHNATVSAACSAVQLDPGPETYESCWQDLSSVAGQLRGLEQRLSGCLARFAGYHGRFTTALFKADDDPTWFTGTSVDSCHRVWFEFHEDLIATLGLSR